MTDQGTAAQPAFLVPGELASLVREGTLDAELAALLSLTVEGGIPVVVAGGEADARRRVRDALLALVPAGRPVVRLAPDEDFAWMPEAGELGWRSSSAPVARQAGAVMVAEVEDGVEHATWGEPARLAIRALTAGYALLVTASGSKLEDVLARLADPPVGATDDELARLGVVLVLAEAAAEPAAAESAAAESAAPHPPVRVAVAHYLRPVARDPGGHIQRLPPAVLATWSAKQERFDHFAWGVVGELAARTGRRPIAFEREQAERAAAIAARAAHGD